MALSSFQGRPSSASSVLFPRLSAAGDRCPLVVSHVPQHFTSAACDGCLVRQLDHTKRAEMVRVNTPFQGVTQITPKMVRVNTPFQGFTQITPQMVRVNTPFQGFTQITPKMFRVNTPFQGFTQITPKMFRVNTPFQGFTQITPKIRRLCFVLIALF